MKQTILYTALLYHLTTMPIKKEPRSTFNTIHNTPRATNDEIRCFLEKRETNKTNNQPTTKSREEQNKHDQEQLNLRKEEKDSKTKLRFYSKMATAVIITGGIIATIIKLCKKT